MSNTDNDNERITVPSHLLARYGRSSDHYVLRVVGDGQREEMICDGDYVIVLRKDTVNPGDLAVVLVGDDATIKRVYPEGVDGRVLRLRSANPDVADITLPIKDVKIQGIVVGLMRNFF